MAEIVLTTLNAGFAHSAFGLRYLLANLGPLQARARLLEFDLHQRTTDVLETILAQEPRIVGLGVYVWNALPSRQLVAELKRLRPDVTVILGGPEVSYETEQQEICACADYVITGEADLAFRRLCQQILEGKPPASRVIAAELPRLEDLELPYHLYNDDDLCHRVIYVEASRGCPFSCEFCLSSLDIPVRNVPLDRFLAAMQNLLDRGARRFKFVDRTFNLNLNISRPILEFFLERLELGLFLHFEMIPDRLPEALRQSIARFPSGAMQLEVGIQTFSEPVAARISRRQDNAKVEENLRWLRERTGVHVHTDLIVGLPGEDLATFAAGFDRLIGLRPQEIQIELLKRLRGTPIIRHDQTWRMVYSPNPPYEVLQTALIDFASMQRMRRFSRYWDLVANSGNFLRTVPLLWEGGGPFQGFMAFSEWLHQRTGRTHGLSLTRLVEMLDEYLVHIMRLDPRRVAQTLAEDYQRNGRRDLPACLRGRVPASPSPAATKASTTLPPRQARHLLVNKPRLP